MKITNLFFHILAVCVLTLVGCKKSDQQDSAQQFHGINVDWPKIETEFAKASQEVHDSLKAVKQFFRYGQFPQALVELDKLSNDPNLAEPQKKLVNDLIQQTKQAIIKTPPPGQ